MDFTARRVGRALVPVLVAVAVLVTAGACSSSNDDEQSGSTREGTSTTKNAPITIETPGPGGKPADGEAENTTTTSEPATGTAPSLGGTWEGVYTCTQGRTGLTLTLDDLGDGTYSGTFEFYAVEGNPNVPSGSFQVEGSYANGEVLLLGTEWINQPSNYVTVDLRATVDAGDESPDRLLGSVTASDGTSSDCTSFAVNRV